MVAFLPRDGREEDAARELAHDFFAKLLAGGAMEGAKPERGRFRSYLLGALKHFAADQWDKVIAAKRGGGVEQAEVDIEMADEAATMPDAEFDHQWALTVLARSLSPLEAEMVSGGKKTHCEALKPCLSAEANSTPQVVAAEKLGLSIEAVKVAVHRLRKRFREAVKTEIAHTVSDAADIREELDALMQALRK
ncbi:MAG: hypothetical protein RIS79_88 [Verrucomicrobiota bacterium]